MSVGDTRMAPWGIERWEAEDTRMLQVSTVEEMRLALGRAVGTVGLVPTMGYLHAGHMALVNRARTENATVVVTIFVNPTQFGPKENFARYPRDEERDLSMLEQAGVDFVFTPSVKEMYAEDFSTYVLVEKASHTLEGAFRPDHFRGVATVVSMLFNIIQADRAYFGQKDAQQVVVVRRMARDLHFKHEIVVVPTVRDADGLALSSRNLFLAPEDRNAALVLSRSLFLARDLYERGERDAGGMLSAMKALLDANPKVKLDYVTICDAQTLEMLKRIEGETLVALAARVGRVRLIDNIVLDCLA
jgi:pantoate--beta-alanine ligase